MWNLELRLEDFKGVFAHVSRTSDRLYFASVEIDKKLFVDSTPRGICSTGRHMASCDLAATSVFLPTIKGEREERAWERGCFLFATRARDSKVSLLAGFRTTSCWYENENVLYPWSWNIRKEFRWEILPISSCFPDWPWIFKGKFPARVICTLRIVL